MYDPNMHEPVFGILNLKQLTAIIGRVAFYSAPALLRCCLLFRSSFICTSYSGLLRIGLISIDSYCEA